jgi:hypothetical protein
VMQNYRLVYDLYGLALEEKQLIAELAKCLKTSPRGLTSRISDTCARFSWHIMRFPAHPCHQERISGLGQPCQAPPQPIGSGFSLKLSQ